jgi:flavin reductase (DIM6/NTAB) family NADH-FMN oxidoreductase RutF
MECRLFQIVTVSRLPLGGSLVIGEVVRFHVSESIIDNYRIDPDAWHPIGRMGGTVYTRTTDRFDMPRPGPVT